MIKINQNIGHGQLWVRGSCVSRGREDWSSRAGHVLDDDDDDDDDDGDDDDDDDEKQSYLTDGQ